MATADDTEITLGTGKLSGAVFWTSGRVRAFLRTGIFAGAEIRTDHRGRQRSGCSDTPRGEGKQRICRDADDVLQVRRAEGC